MRTVCRLGVFLLTTTVVSCGVAWARPGLPDRDLDLSREVVAPAPTPARLQPSAFAESATVLSTVQIASLGNFARKYQSMSDLHLAAWISMVAGSVVGGALLAKGGSSGTYAIAAGLGVGSVLDLIAMFEERSAANALDPIVATAVREGAIRRPAGWTDLPPPGNVRAVVDGAAVVVSWDPVPSSSLLAGYLVRRASAADAEGVVLTESPITATVFRDAGGHAHVGYSYWVTARTMAGGETVPSAKATIEYP